MMNSIAIKDKIDTAQLLKIAPFRKGVRVTKPHKHNSYFEIIFLTKGSGIHSIDAHNYQVKPPIVFFVRKEQIHFWDLTSEPEGYVLIIKKSFVDTSLDREIKTLLYKLSRFSAIPLKKPEIIDTLLYLLTKETLVEHIFSQAVVEGLLKSLLAKLLQEEVPYQDTPPKDLNLYGQFRELLSQEMILRNSVAYYAAQLNTSPQNLNSACRKTGDISAADVLSEFIINEAKRHLLYTDNTIAEIAFHLNFNDSSHFIKYFKRFTAVTPQSFRTEHI